MGMILSIKFKSMILIKIIFGIIKKLIFLKNNVADFYTQGICHGNQSDSYEEKLGSNFI